MDTGLLFPGCRQSFPEGEASRNRWFPSELKNLPQSAEAPAAPETSSGLP